MPRVVSVSSAVHDLTGGLGEFEVAALTLRGVLRELEARFPGLGNLVESQMALAIDGEIHQDAEGAEIGPGSEIVLIPRISGG